MQFLRASSLLFVMASAMWALPVLPITFQDKLDSDDPSDVIGDPNYFEIDYLKLAGFSANTLQVDIRFNFGGGTALNAFTVSGFAPALNVGDLFFRTAGNTYAFILNSHDGLTTNGLYKITGTQASKDVLGNPSGSYRGDSQVWAAPGGATLLSTGSANISTVGGVKTFLFASLYLPLDGTTLSDLNNGFDVYFASATCGNDEVTGTVPSSAVPEPSSFLLLGAGLMGFGLLRRRA